MNENTSSAFGGYGFVVFIVLLFWLFMGGNGCGGWNRGGWGNCAGASPCEIEKQEIIDSATTQFKVVDTAKATQEVVNAAALSLGNKIDFYEYQNLRDQLAQERTKNVVLENRVYSDAQFNALTAQGRDMYNALQAQISELSCNVPKRPPYFAQGFVTCGQTIPAGYCNSCN